MIERRATKSTPMAHIALGCIGSRELPPEAAAACRQIAGDLVRGGYHIVTGSTPGEPDHDSWADWASGAFAYGAARVSPTSLTVCLPWRHFPRGSGAPPASIAVRYPDDHPEWNEAASAFWEAQRGAGVTPWNMALPRATRLRHIRTIGIVLESHLVLAWPHGQAEGTRFALRFAAWRGIPTLDLTQTTWWTVAPTLVARLAASVCATPSATRSEATP